MVTSVFRDENDMVNNAETTTFSCAVSCLEGIEHSELTREITPASVPSGQIQVTRAIPLVNVPSGQIYLPRAIPSASSISGHSTAEQQQVIGK